MKSDPTISIILPVYNSSDYLEECVCSVLEQSFRNIEVLAINDGSTDESGNILDRFAKSDQRLKVFHTANNGVGAARNVGLANARGAYIAFLDADDTFEPDMMNEMLAAMSRSLSEFVICDVNLIPRSGSGHVRLGLKNAVWEVDNSRSHLIEQMMQFRYDYANWNKLFNADIIKQHCLRFEEDMNLWEDLLFNLQYLHYVSRIATVHQPLYNYRITSGSLNHSKTNRLEEFNKLYQHYMAWSAGIQNEEERVTFRKEMGRIMYFQVLQLTREQVKAKGGSFFTRCKEFADELHSVDANIFFFPGPLQLKVETLMKKILLNRWFSLFSLISTLRGSFR